MLGISWAAKSLIATLCLVPFLLAIGFLGRNYQVRAEATMIWYFFGIVIGAPIVMWRLNIINGSDLALTMPHFAVLLMGMVLGVASNILLVQAISVAPNPGLPMAFVNSASVIAFMLAPVLGILLPRYFDQARFDIYQFVGIVLTVVGISLIMLKR
ncbi:MAG: hypothetical protein UY97_C0001G0073 [Parcubacteria group bacterium GW2011_GWB1_57_6]|nr:MAG: hypothetical protein UY93_C0001G0003 [Parcubacteria group bacterium GW2011_GWA1_56_13]KKW47016.1 MAG: hypothetical protein UY97_C0001G0073 [Parcubacteria group bacterium GW2011_GWB1_57_6]